MGCCTSTAENTPSGGGKSEDRRVTKVVSGKKGTPLGGGNTAAAPADKGEDLQAVSGQPEKARTPKEGLTETTNDGRRTEGGVNAAPAVLTVTLLSDLRTRQSKEHGTSVSRWIESIVEPGAENPETYDPLKRHALSMDSLHTKLQVVQQTK